MLLHYLAKIECSAAQLLQHIIQCKCDAESFIYSIRLPEMLISVSYVYTQINLQYYMQHVLKLSALKTHECFVVQAHSRKVTRCVSDALLNAAEKNV